MDEETVAVLVQSCFRSIKIMFGVEDDAPQRAENTLLTHHPLRQKHHWPGRQIELDSISSSLCLSQWSSENPYDLVPGAAVLWHRFVLLVVAWSCD